MHPATHAHVQAVMAQRLDEAERYRRNSAAAPGRLTWTSRRPRATSRALRRLGSPTFGAR